MIWPHVAVDTEGLFVVGVLLLAQLVAAVAAVVDGMTRAAGMLEEAAMGCQREVAVVLTVTVTGMVGTSLRAFMIGWRVEMVVELGAEVEVEAHLLKLLDGETTRLVALKGLCHLDEVFMN